MKTVTGTQDADDRHKLLHGHEDSSSAPAANLQANKDAAWQSTSANWTCVLLAVPGRIWNSGLTCAFLASLIFSFSSLFVKLTGGRVPVLEVCFIRSSISFALTLVLMKTTGMSPIFGQRKNIRLLFLRGCCGACSMTSNYVGLLLLPLGDAVTIGLIGPAVTATAARIFLKEPLGYRGVLGVIVSMVGVTVLSKPPFLFGGEQWEPNQAVGVTALVLSAFLGAGSSMTIRLIGGKEPAAVIAMWFHTCTMILTAMPLSLGIPAKFTLLAPKDFGFMMGVACTSFVAQLLSTRGLQMVVAAKAAATGFTQVFYSYVMGAIFFGERMSSTGLLGVLLIVIGVMLVTLRSSKTFKPAAAVPEQLAGDSKLAADSAKLTAADAEQARLLDLSAESADITAAGAVDAAVIVRAPSKLSAAARPVLSTADSVPEADDTVGLTPSARSAFLRGLVPAAAAGGDLNVPEYERQLAFVAAQSAAALGGELDPATAASLAASRQASLELGLRAELRASRRFSRAAGPASEAPAGPEASILSPTPSAFRAGGLAAGLAASQAVDVPGAGPRRGITRQVSGWLAANLLGATPADFVPQSSSLRPGTAVQDEQVGTQDAGAGASTSSSLASRTPSRQLSSWLTRRLSSQQPTQDHHSERLTEALLQPAAASLTGTQDNGELSLNGLRTLGDGSVEAMPTAGVQTAGSSRDRDEQSVRAASHLAREGSIEHSAGRDVTDREPDKATAMHTSSEL